VDDCKPVQKHASAGLHRQQDALPIRLCSQLEVPIYGHRAILRTVCQRAGALPSTLRVQR